MGGGEGEMICYCLDCTCTISGISLFWSAEAYNVGSNNVSELCFFHLGCRVGNVAIFYQFSSLKAQMKLHGLLFLFVPPK